MGVSGAGRVGVGVGRNWAGREEVLQEKKDPRQVRSVVRRVVLDTQDFDIGVKG